MPRVYEKLRSFKEFTKVIFPQVTEEELGVMVDHICREQDGTRKALTEKEEMLKTAILRQGYKAKTIHSWFRVLKFPRHLQEQIKDGQVSVMEALAINKELRLKTDAELNKEILTAIRQDVAHIEEFISERLDNVRRKTE